VSAQTARQAPRTTRGFSLVEIVVTLSIIGIIALVAVPRFVGTGAFESPGFYDRAEAIVRFAQKTAIAQRRNVFVVIPVAGNRISACYDGACASRVLTPVDFPRTPSMSSALANCANDTTWLCAGTPSGVTLSVTSFSFDGLGRPSAAATIVFSSTIVGDAPRQIAIAAETGYVQ
jgi:MSHA pilin protein MshC